MDESALRDCAATLMPEAQAELERLVAIPSNDESVSLRELERFILAEALLLRGLGRSRCAGGPAGP